MKPEETANIEHSEYWMRAAEAIYAYGMDRGIDLDAGDLDWICEALQSVPVPTRGAVDALEEALDLAGEGIDYTGDYFVKKWKMDERYDALKAKLDQLRGR